MNSTFPSRAGRAPLAPWLLPVLLAALSTMGPFCIDAYMPAFAGMGAGLGASKVQMQQTLSAYLFGFAFMNLFHGALSDALGRRPVIGGSTALFALASAGCALSGHVGWLIFWRAVQGLAAGAGSVVGRAVIRDLFPAHQAQRMMAQVTIYFGVAPAVAPLLGGWVYVHLGWHAVFWMLAVVGLLLTLMAWRWLPESLPPERRMPFHPAPLVRGYARLLGSLRFLLLVMASGVPFNGMFLYVLAAPVFLGDILHLEPTQFAWFFAVNVAGIMLGAWLSGRLAGRMDPVGQMRLGFRIMAAISLVNVLLNHLLVPHVGWALLPVAIYSVGWAVVAPVVNLLVLDAYPERRGTAASLQAFVAAATNGVVAGALAPLVMHDARLLAWASLALMTVGWVAAMWAGSHRDQILAGAQHAV